MNWKIRHLHPAILLGILLTACDSFQEDVLPKSEDELAVQGAVSILPGTVLFLDLKDAVNASGAVQVRIELEPAKGTANIDEDAILKYTPNPDFLTGQDFMSLNLINQEGSTIDTDSVFINVVQSTDSLPCQNGALSDYYSTPNDQVLVFSPLLNDGLCGDEISEVCLNFTTQPEHGQLVSGDSSFTYQYIPEANFIGTDIFMYELTISCADGNSKSSMAQISIDVYDDLLSGCDSMVYPFHYVLEWPLEEYYIFEPFKPHPLCDVFEWTVDSLFANSGQVEVNEDEMINYFPGTASEDLITYRISFGGRKFHNSIHIQIAMDDTISCPDAIDDEFYLYIVEDSIGTIDHPHILPPANNDTFCTEAFTIDILESPSVGVATVTDEQLIEYYVEEEFSGVTETTLKYELCNDGQCDAAYVQIILEM